MPPRAIGSLDGHAGHRDGTTDYATESDVVLGGFLMAGGQRKQEG
ncbi:hypothetical protein GCM10028797_01240 [Dyella agri]